MITKIKVYLFKVALLFLAYFITARVGLSFDAVSGFATLVWPPTGISLSALLLYGYWMWPGILLAAFLVNFSVGASLPVALGIGLGNTLGPLFAAFMYRRIAGTNQFFGRLKNILSLIFFGGVLSTMISASIGSNSLLLGGTIERFSYGSTWAAWWIGDMLGILIITPLILSFVGNWGISKFETSKRAEVWLIFISVILVSMMAFWDILRDNLHNFPTPISYLIFPPLIWAALRFDARVASLSIAILSALSIWGTASGFGPFATEMLSQGLLYLQIYIASTAVTIMILIAVVSERKLAESKLEELNQKLEDRVGEQTHKLKQSEAKLADYAKELEVKVADRTKELNEKVEDLEKLNQFMIGRELKMIQLKEEIKDLKISAAKPIKPRLVKK